MRAARRWRGAALLAVLVVAACGGDGDDGGSETTAPPTSATASTLPRDVEPGTGWISLEGDSVSLEVGECLGPDADNPDRLFSVTATGTPDGDEITVTASTLRTQGDQTATTEAIVIRSGAGAEERGLEAKRAHFNGRWLDLNEPTATGPLLDRDDGLVSAEARFGPQGSRRGDPGIVDGAFIARCP